MHRGHQHPRLSTTTREERREAYLAASVIDCDPRTAIAAMRGEHITGRSAERLGRYLAERGLARCTPPEAT